MYRSHRLDILDDLSGKSCGPLTLRRLDWLEQAVQNTSRPWWTIWP
jgi:hypothetical protein